MERAFSWATRQTNCALNVENNPQNDCEIKNSEPQVPRVTHLNIMPKSS